MKHEQFAPLTPAEDDLATIRRTVGDSKHAEGASETLPLLLSVARVRELLTRDRPDYGQSFSESEWEDIAERLSALTRLLWKAAERRVQNQRFSRHVHSAKQEN